MIQIIKNVCNLLSVKNRRKKVNNKIYITLQYC